jgi:hypothetical protein
MQSRITLKEGKQSAYPKNENKKKERNVIHDIITTWEGGASVNKLQGYAELELRQ